MDLSISHEEYEKYLLKKETVNNTRYRPSGENFFDAMMSVDLESLPAGEEIAEAIRKLD